jgi:CheY-like chemotaxis protein
MKNEVIILIAEDDEGHATLIRKNLERAGIDNRMYFFKDGQEVLDFFFCEDDKPAGQCFDPKGSYLLLLDIRMPKVDGVEVLKRIKHRQELTRIPVIIITTTDDPHEVASCHEAGCNSYLVKPVDYEKFVDAIRKLGLFLLVVEVPKLE